jgi:hypothetical protein
MRLKNAGGGQKMDKGSIRACSQGLKDAIRFVAPADNGLPLGFCSFC